MTFLCKTVLLSILCAPVGFAQLIDPGDLGGSVCTGVLVNVGGSVAGTCRNTAGNFVAFLKLPDPAVIAALPVAATGQPCGVMDMNNNNVISGNCEMTSGLWVPVRWQAGSPPPAPQILQPLTGATLASARSINQTGVIVGESINGGTSTVVIWPGGSTTATALPLPGLLGLGTIGCSSADVNDTTSPGPAVAGNCVFTDGSVHAFVWTPTGLLGTYVATQLSAVAGGTNCNAVDINASAQVAGTCQNAAGNATAVRWPAGGTTPVSLDSVLPAGTSSSGVAINAAGLMTGNFITTGGDGHCFFWNPNNGVMNDLGLLTGATWCRAADINGQNNTIVGTAGTGSGTKHAFIWRQATGIIDLGTLGGPNSTAADISDNSRVVGTSEGTSPGKKPRAFYSDPL